MKICWVIRATPNDANVVAVEIETKSGDALFVFDLSPDDAENAGARLIDAARVARGAK